MTPIHLTYFLKPKDFASIPFDIRFAIVITLK